MGIRPSKLLVRINSSSDFSAVTMETATGMETATADSIALTKKLVSSEDRHGAMLTRPEAEPTRWAAPAVRLLACFTAGLTTTLLLAALRASVVCIEKESEGETRRERRRQGEDLELDMIS